MELDALMWPTQPRTAAGDIPFGIRPARSADAAPLARLADATFRQAFASSNSGEDMELHCRNTYGEAIQAAEIADRDRVTILAEADGQLVGFGQLRWGQPPDCVRANRAAEIQRLYVDRPWHGRGVAQALMEALMDAAAEGGAQSVWLGVWEKNPRALAFYLKSGFVEVGEHTFVVGHDAQRDLLLARRSTRGQGG
jgi:diamine N-acetyltransferase